MGNAFLLTVTTTFNILETTFHGLLPQKDGHLHLKEGKKLAKGTPSQVTSIKSLYY